MAELTITTELDNLVFVPGETINGRVSWAGVDGGSNDAEIRLFYYTTGKGSRDVGIVATELINHPGPSGERDFRFTIPQHAPPSLSGKILSVIWAIEFQVGRKHGHTEILKVTVSPTGEELSLYKYGTENLPDYSNFSIGKGKKFGR